MNNLIKEKIEEFCEKFGLVSMDFGEKLPRIVVTEEVISWVSKSLTEVYNSGREDERRSLRKVIEGDDDATDTLEEIIKLAKL